MPPLPTSSARHLLDRLSRLMGAGDTRAWLAELFEPAPATAAGAPSRDHPAADPITQLLDEAGAPTDLEFRYAWRTGRMELESQALLARLIEATRPGTPDDWDALLPIYAMPLASQVLLPLLEAGARLDRPFSLASLARLAKRYPRPGMAQGFLRSLAAFKPAALDTDALVEVLARHVDGDERGSAIAGLGHLLAGRGCFRYAATQLDELITRFGNRAAGKRLAGTVALFDEYGLTVDLFDPFVASFAGDAAAGRWLACALAELSELRRGVTRLELMRLREWAADETSVARYARGARALAEAGLDAGAIDALLLPCLRDEESTAVACLVGQLGSRLYPGGLDIERAKRLLASLPGRAAVKRFEQAMRLLSEVGLGPADVEALADSFVTTRDDVLWLEALVRDAHEDDVRLTRLEVLRLRERYPDPGMLYRYFRLRRTLAPFDQLGAANRDALVDAAALDEGRTGGLRELAQLMIRRGRSRHVEAPTLEALHAAFPTALEVRRYERATATYEGSARAIDALAVQHATTDERATAMGLVGSLLAQRGLNHVERNPRLADGLATLLERGLGRPTQTPTDRLAS